MVAREAIYNAVRHGQPGRVQLGLRFEEDNCCIRVQDDGSGVRSRLSVVAPGRATTA